MERSDHSVDDDLLAKYFAGEANDAEKSVIRAWKLTSSENEKEYNDLAAAWGKTNELAPVTVDTQEAWLKVKSQIKRETPPAEMGFQAVFRIAASLLISAGLCYYIVNKLENESSAGSMVEVVETILPDGTAITLNRGAEIKYVTAFDAPTREVSLFGEAFFDVERDETRPFIIHTNKVNVKVLGTSFNVATDEDLEQVTVVVATGRVLLYSQSEQIDADSSAVELLPGEKGIYTISTGRVNKVTNKSPAFMFWKDRKLVFKRTSLAKVVEVLNEMYDTRIAIESNEILKCKLTATFTDQSIAAILEVITSTLSLELKDDGSVIQLYGEGC